MNGDPTKYPEWYKKYLRGIMQVESSGGNPDEFFNPGSSATGMYQQLYKQVKDLPVMQGVDRKGFAADTALQNKVMGMRFLDDLPGVTGELRNATDLTERFAPKFGDKWNYRPDEVAAMSYFIGRQGTINYMNHLLKGGEPEDFKVSGGNMTVPKYMKVYNEGFGGGEEQPQEKQVTPDLQKALDIMKRDNRFGGRVLKKKNYGQNGMLVQKDPTLVPEPPEDPPSDEVLARLSLGITPPDQQFRLSGGDAPFRTIKEQKDVIAQQESEGDIMEILRYLPVTGEAIDTYELGKVMATGEDIYGEEQDPGVFAAMTAAGYVIPNALEKPLKSAWRAVKKFPDKMPKKEFRELIGPEKEQARANLLQGHLEVYGRGGYRNLQSGATPVNVRQLPSLMSGSKLENAVDKDGFIKVSEIERLIDSKGISEAERSALKDAMQSYSFEHDIARKEEGVREALGGIIDLEGVDLSMASQVAAKQLQSTRPVTKVNYNQFRELVATRNTPFRVDQSKEYAGYGVDRLGLNVRFSNSPDMALADDVGLARTNLIRTTDPELQSTEYGHFGEDVIGHYRTFERPDEEGVLYISELQSDPLQARGPAGQKTVGLNVKEALTDRDVKDKLEVAKGYRGAAKLALQDISEGRNPERMLKLLAKPTDVQWDIDPKTGMPLRQAYVFPRDIQEATGRTPAFSNLSSEQILESVQAYNPEKSDVTERYLSAAIEEYDDYIQALEGGYRGGPNPKQANLIKNQDQFLISHILEQEAKGADKLRFPTGETTSKIQGYGDIQVGVDRAQRNLDIEKSNLKNLMTSPGGSSSRIANRVEGMGLSGMEPDKALDFLGRVRAYRTRKGIPRDLASDPGIQYSQSVVDKFDNDALKQAYKELKAMTPEDRQLEINFHGGTIEKAAEQRAINIKKDIHSWNEQLERIKSKREHLERVNASTQATQGIMKGYDRLPKSLKKHGLDATKVTDDAGNTWWEVDIPARLGEGVGEVRAYRSGGQVSDKIRVLKKEGRPQNQAVAIALAMQESGKL